MFERQRKSLHSRHISKPGEALELDNDEVEERIDMTEKWMMTMSSLSQQETKWVVRGYSQQWVERVHVIGQVHRS